MARPAKWSSSTTAIRLPEKYANFMEEFARNLEELESFVQNSEPPFHVGDKVVINFYPDDYRVVEVLEISNARQGYADFYCLHPDTGERMRWIWHSGSSTVPLREGESLDLAIKRSIIQKSLRDLIHTEFRKQAVGLNSLTLETCNS